VAADEAQSDAALRDYLEVLVRAKWIIALVVVVVPVVAILMALRQPAVYEASAQVLISRQNLATQLDNISDPTTLDPARTVETYAELARVPEVARRALEAAQMSERDASVLLAASSVAPMDDTDLLAFTVRDGDRSTATRLATEYAKAFVAYRRELDVGALESARVRVEDRIDQLEAREDQDSALYQTLVEKEQQLATMEALQAGRAAVVRVPSTAAQVEPRPEKSGLIGLVIGVVFAAALAFLYDALDSRVRSQRTILVRLGLPLLGRIPKPPRKLRRRKQLLMVAAPFSYHAEAFRLLRSNIEFANSRKGQRVIMVTSGGAGEGKSTTVANLAVAFASSGRHTVLVNLDLAASFVNDAFDLDGRAGLSDLVVGQASLDDALVDIPVAHIGPHFPTDGPGVSRAGRLEVLSSAAQPTSALGVVTLEGIRPIFEDLSRRADIVLVDAPPLLLAGDTLALTACVDALIVVTRLNMVRSQTLDELRRVLDVSPAEKLGVIVTGTDDRPGYYGGSYFTRSGSSAAALPPDDRRLRGKAKAGGIAASLKR
jgi:Mrp family chromosome partitioning ATPase/capsular polysaccharide biosynthesis protein